MTATLIIYAAKKIYRTSHLYERLLRGTCCSGCRATFDTSGNGKLNGDYFVRQVLTTDLDANTSAIGRAISLTGIMTFRRPRQLHLRRTDDGHPGWNRWRALFDQRVLLGGIQRHGADY